jgi:hypothetical protein
MTASILARVQWIVLNPTNFSQNVLTALSPRSSNCSFRRSTSLAAPPYRAGVHRDVSAGGLNAHADPNDEVTLLLSRGY